MRFYYRRMPLLTTLVFFAVAGHSLAKDRFPLRDGCDEDASTLAVLPVGAPVEIRFALAGGAGDTCYKVKVQVNGAEREGYLPGSAISRIEAFEQQRAQANDVGAARAWSAPLENWRRKAESGPMAASDRPLMQAASLLEEHKNVEALQSLEVVLQTRPKDSQVLALAGIAAYRADETKKAIQYLRASVEIQPEPQLLPLLAKLEREAKHDTSGERLLGTRFLLRYDQATVDPDVARGMVQVLEQEYSRVAGVLGCNTSERIVTIVQNPAAYQAGSNVAEWSGGHFDGKIHIPVSDGRQISPRMRQTFAHEIVHACLSSMGQWPAWLHEGLAQRLSGEGLSSADLQTVRTLVRNGRVPKLNDLRQDWSRMSTYNAGIAYKYSLAAAQLLLEAPGVGVVNLLRNPALLAQATARLDEQLAN